MTRLRPTLRARLTLQLTLVTLISLLAFSEVAKDVIASTQRDWVNAQLTTAVLALSMVASRSSPVQTARALVRLADRDYDGAILTRAGKVITTSAPVPDIARSHVSEASRDVVILRVGSGVVQLRMALVGLPDSKNVAIFWHLVDRGGVDADERIGMLFGWAVPAIAAIALLIGNELTRRALKPLVMIGDMAATIEAHDLSQRIDPVPQDAELADLSTTINRMLARLEAGFERQRRFTADVSHEFRAPLSVITAEADLAACGLDSLEEYRNASLTILREAKLIERITENLLLLARADAGFADTLSNVDVVAAAATAVQTLQATARTHRVIIRTRFDRSAFIQGNATSLVRVAIALIHNAIKFTRAESHIDVDVRVSEGRVELSVSDEGPGFSAEAKEHAFERFWRGDPARVRSGNGLGLAIVFSLVEQMSGTISMLDSPQGGGLVVTSFPTSHS